MDNSGRPPNFMLDRYCSPFDSKERVGLNVGTLFGDLIASVERAEKAISKPAAVPSEQYLCSKDFASMEMLLAEQSGPAHPLNRKQRISE